MSDAGEPMDRLAILKQAFGADNAAAAEKTLVDLQANAYKAYEHKLKLNEPVMKARQELGKKIPQFWYNSLRNCRQTGQFIDPVDEEVLKQHLQDIWIEHDKKDVREWEVTFTFSDNPYFSNSSLSRKFVLTPPKGSSAAEPAQAHDLNAPLYLSPLASSSRVQWKSDEKNLCKKAPRQDPRELEEFDEFAGAGSFFSMFEEKADGDDIAGVGETLLEWWANATEYAAGITSLDDLSSDEEGMMGMMGGDSDSDEDDEDPAKEIDLGSEEEEERPRKRSKGRK